MLRTYRWRGAMWRFEDGKAPEDAKLVEVMAKPVTPEAPKRRATRTRKQKTEE